MYRVLEAILLMPYKPNANPNPSDITTLDLYDTFGEAR